MHSVKLTGASYHPHEATLATIPGDKSISHRIAILGSLADGETRFSRFLCSEDCLNTVSIMRAMGADIELDTQTGDGIIRGSGLHGLKQPIADLDVGNSGTSIRLLSGLLAAQSFDVVLTGDASIVQRPMKRVIDPLSQMGAQIVSRTLPGRDDLFPPLQITGSSLASIRYELPVASAQVKSAILLAGLFATGKTVVVEPRKTRDHTEKLLNGFGVSCDVLGTEITLSPPNQLVAPKETLMTPADFSSASFFMVLAAVSPGMDLVIRTVGLNPTRRALLDVLLDMGADITLENKGGDQFEPYADLRIRGKALKNITLSADLVPFIIDEIPILAVAALFSKGTLIVRDAEELRVKESDRIQGIVQLVRAFGCEIEEVPDGFTLSGQPVSVDSVVYDCLHDHRLAMSAVVAAMLSGAELSVSDTSCIQTSFPSFFTCLEQLGVAFKTQT